MWNFCFWLQWSASSEYQIWYEKWSWCCKELWEAISGDGFYCSRWNCVLFCELFVHGWDYQHLEWKWTSKGEMHSFPLLGEKPLSLTIQTSPCLFFLSFSPKGENVLLVGYVASFPCKYLMILLFQEIMQHKLVFIETQDVVETTLALDNYRRACDCGRGAVFFSVARYQNAIVKS